MKQDEQLYTLALTRIPGLGHTTVCNLIKAVGSATEIFNNRKSLPELIPGASIKLVQALNCPEAFQRAEKELIYADKNRIQCITITDENYPARLRECNDAPIALFFRGNIPLNTLHIVSIVGTRHSTAYGLDICNNFIADLSQLVTDVLIVSGLDYGIHKIAHRAALQNNLNTVGVLAHGLDRIYPSAHRAVAIKMMEQGGLLTEFMSETNPDRQNFVKRNRIVAGMADVTIVVESAAKGGALITAELAESYHRDCFAFPGRCTDTYSVGCNELIRTNRASILTNAQDFVESMGWLQTKQKENVQRELFPDLNNEEQCIVNLLQKHTEGLQINTLVVQADLPISQLSTLLFELEMKGVVKAMAGGVYKLID